MAKLKLDETIKEVIAENAKIKDELNIRNLTIFKLSKEYFLENALIQREYEWELSKIVKFLRSLYKSNNTDKNFIGLMLTTLKCEEKILNKEQLLLVDGQQRLTTICLAIAAVRVYAKSILRSGDYEGPKTYTALKEAEELTQNFLFTDGEDGFSVPFLKSNNLGGKVLQNILWNNDITFEEILTFKNEEKYTDYEVHVAKAFEVIYNYITSKEIRKNLSRFTNLLTHNLRFVNVIYDKNADAALAFQRLNSFSKVLTFSDYVKGMIGFSRNAEGLMKTWDDIRKVLNSKKELEDYIINFLKAYYHRLEIPDTDKNRVNISKAELHEIINNLFEHGLLNIENFIIRLEDQMQHYISISRLIDNNSVSKPLFSYFVTFNKMGYRQCRPLLLLLSRLSNKEQAIEIAELTFRLSFQRQTLLGKDGKQVTPTINRVINTIRNRLYDLIGFNGDSDKFELSKEDMVDIREAFIEVTENNEQLLLAIRDFLQRDIDNRLATGIHSRLEYFDSSYEKMINIGELQADHYFPDIINKLKHSELSRLHIDLKDFQQYGDTILNKRPLLEKHNKKKYSKMPSECINYYLTSEFNTNKNFYSNEIDDFMKYIAETKALLTPALCRLAGIEVDERVLDFFGIESLDSKIVKSA